ncbi:hypothetical protein [Nesterenkonia pannonica]|uniref:hypothetical protein n=1 Tax=Nesterenkonia pannonica TaxID=1548602 RepID=UPI002164144A|nr:hypothetical protein [Nesterenkonia pannonica]
MVTSSIEAPPRPPASHATTVKELVEHLTSAGHAPILTPESGTAERTPLTGATMSPSRCG